MTYGNNFNVESARPKNETPKREHHKQKTAATAAKAWPTTGNGNDSNKQPIVQTYSNSTTECGKERFSAIVCNLGLTDKERRRGGWNGTARIAHDQGQNIYFWRFALVWFGSFALFSFSFSFLIYFFVFCVHILPSILHLFLVYEHFYDVGFMFGFIFIWFLSALSIVFKVFFDAI